MSTPNKVAQGITEDFALQIVDRFGAPFTTYTGTEVLTGTVRLGADFPAIFTITPTWITANAGTIAVVIDGDDTEDLDVGRYLIQITLADLSADLYEGWLEVTYSPGAAVALVSYGSHQDMLDMAPGVEKFARPTDLAGYAKQRQIARRWFEDLLHRHDRGLSGLATDTAFGWGAVGYSLGYRDGRRSPQLTAWLAADALVVTDQVVAAVTAHAVAQLYDRQASMVSDGASFAAQARKFFARAENAASGITAELITDGGSVTNYVIRLGSADTLEG